MEQQDRSGVNTYDYLKPSDLELKVMEVIRGAFKELDQLLSQNLPGGRYKSLTKTALEEAAMWANKSITRD